MVVSCSCRICIVYEIVLYCIVLSHLIDTIGLSVSMGVDECVYLKVLVSILVCLSVSCVY